MKIDLTEEGTLVVSAETGTEAFALQAWSDRHQHYLTLSPQERANYRAPWLIKATVKNETRFVK